MGRCNVCYAICTKVCGGCATVFYCSRECQISEHPKHKEECANKRVEREIKEKGLTYNQYAHYRVREAEMKAIEEGRDPFKARELEKEKLIKLGFPWNEDDDLNYLQTIVSVNVPIHPPKRGRDLPHRPFIHRGVPLLTNVPNPHTPDYLDLELRDTPSTKDFLNSKLKDIPPTCSFLDGIELEREFYKHSRMHQAFLPVKNQLLMLLD